MNFLNPMIDSSAIIVFEKKTFDQPFIGSSRSPEMDPEEEAYQLSE